MLHLPVLCSRCDQRQLDAIIACQCALAHLVYTRSGLVSLSDIPIRRSSDVTSPFPPSGNEGYIRNQDVSEAKPRNAEELWYRLGLEYLFATQFNTDVKQFSESVAIQLNVSSVIHKKAKSSSICSGYTVNV